MVLTPFHLGFVWPVFLRFKGKLDIYAISIASMFPDLENPILFLLTNGQKTRLILHSFLGSILVGLPLVMVILWGIQKEFPNHFASNGKIFGRRMMLSGMIGLVNHVIIDSFVLHHNSQGMPLFYPVTGQTFSFLVFDPLSTTIVWHAIAIVLFLYYGRIVIKHVKP